MKSNFKNTPPSSQVSVIIPCYNDGTRISPVISEAKKSPSVAEIIVVDDGSDSQTQKILQGISGIKLCRHPTNLGKSQAIKTGVLHATKDITVFIDSDLINFSVNHLEALIDPIVAGKYDLALGSREKESFHTVVTGFADAFTGERATRTRLLLENLDLLDVPRYLIEPSLNRRFFRNFKIAKVKFPGVSQYGKNQKYGLKGWLKDLSMTFDYIKFLGPAEFLYQMVFAKHLPYVNQL